MSNFTPLTGSQILQRMLEQYASEASTAAATDPGSTMGAMFEAETLLALQLQQQIIYLFTISRLASCNGADVDSFVNPFGCFRNGPNSATGTVTFTYPVGAGAQTILNGAMVQTEDGAIFTVVPDPNNTTGDYNVSLGNGYTNTGVVTVLVQCNQTGLIGNVLANTITLQYSGGFPIPGSPVITNPNAFTNGVANETDAQLKQRFAFYISGGGSGTPNAIIAAIAGFVPPVGSGMPNGASLTFSYGDMWSYAPSGAGLVSNTPGWFTIIVNVANQNGLPPVQLLGPPANSGGVGGSSLPGGYLSQTIIDAVRPAGIAFAIIAPTLITVSGSGKVVVANGYNAAAVVQAVNNAFGAFVNGIGLDPLGNSTVCSLMAAYVALSQVPGVLRIDSLLLNGTTNDVTATFGNQLVAGSASFTQ